MCWGHEWESPVVTIKQAYACVCVCVPLFNTQHTSFLSALPTSVTTSRVFSNSLLLLPVSCCSHRQCLKYTQGKHNRARSHIHSVFFASSLAPLPARDQQARLLPPSSVRTLHSRASGLIGQPLHFSSRPWRREAMGIIGLLSFSIVWIRRL